MAKKSSSSKGSKSDNKSGQGWKPQGGYGGSSGKDATVTRRPPRQPGR